MTFLNALATSIGWILMMGSLFWGLCIAASYAHIGLRRLVNRNHH
jgi:hypothetical protein